MRGWENSVVAPSFEELMDPAKEQTPTEKVLLQAVARIGARAGRRDMSPEEVYLMLVEQAEKAEKAEQAEEATEPRAESLGVYLRDMRERAGWSLCGLAEASGLGQGRLSRIENGRWDGRAERVPDASLGVIAHTLGLDADEVFWMAGRLPPDFRNLMMEAGPGHWKSLRRRFARNG